MGRTRHFSINYKDSVLCVSVAFDATKRWETNYLGKTQFLIDRMCVFLLYMVPLHINMAKELILPVDMD
jgi:hypothetical protein